MEETRYSSLVRRIYKVVEYKANYILKIIIKIFNIINKYATEKDSGKKD